MPRTPRQRQCPRCGRQHPGNTRVCSVCTTALVRRRWRMTPERIRYLHALALRQKGLSRELYELNLEAVGVRSCKKLDEPRFRELVRRLHRLPDVPGWRM